MKRFTLFSWLLLSANTAIAEQPPVDTPPPPPGLSEDEDIQPEVKIIKREDKTIEEYRINGRLYMIKVTPTNAPPYFLVDSDGNGTMDAHRTELEPKLMIPQWVLFRW